VPVCRAFVGFSWRWGESNPRPRATVQGFSGRSRWEDLASRLPPAEDLSASPGSMSGAAPGRSLCREPAHDAHPPVAGDREGTAT
jgi:hypothetical protein